MQICFMKPGDTLSALFAELRHRAGTAASPYLWVTNRGPETISRLSFSLRGMGLVEKKGASCVSHKMKLKKHYFRAF